MFVMALFIYNCNKGKVWKPSSVQQERGQINGVLPLDAGSQKAFGSYNE